MCEFISVDFFNTFNQQARTYDNLIKYCQRIEAQYYAQTFQIIMLNESDKQMFVAFIFSGKGVTTKISVSLTFLPKVWFSLTHSFPFPIGLS